MAQFSWDAFLAGASTGYRDASEQRRKNEDQAYKKKQQDWMEEYAESIKNAPRPPPSSVFNPPQGPTQTTALPASPLDERLYPSEALPPSRPRPPAAAPMPQSPPQFGPRPAPAPAPQQDWSLPTIGQQYGPAPQPIAPTPLPPPQFGPRIPGAATGGMVDTSGQFPSGVGAGGMVDTSGQQQPAASPSAVPLATALPTAGSPPPPLPTASENLESLKRLYPSEALPTQPESMPADAFNAAEAAKEYRSKYLDWIATTEAKAMKAGGLDALQSFRTLELEKSRRTMLGHTTGAIFSAARAGDVRLSPEVRRASAETAVQQLNNAVDSNIADLGVRFKVGPKNTILTNEGAPVDASQLFDWQAQALTDEKSYMEYLKYQTTRSQDERRLTQDERRLTQDDRRLTQGDRDLILRGEQLGINRADLASNSDYRAAMAFIEEQKLGQGDREMDLREQGRWNSGKGSTDPMTSFLARVLIPSMADGTFQQFGLGGEGKVTYALGLTNKLTQMGYPPAQAWLQTLTIMNGPQPTPAGPQPTPMPAGPPPMMGVQ